MAFARRAGGGSAREEVKASARARPSRGDDVREKERLEQDVGRETVFQKNLLATRAAATCRGRSLCAAATCPSPARARLVSACTRAR